MADPAIEVATALIKQFEGCHLAAYPDPGSGGAPYTIGWGATGPGIGPGVVWTQATADARLTQDVARFAKGVRDLVKVETNPNQLGALISFAYNVGLANLKGSTLLRKLNAGDYEGAAQQFPRWDRAAGKQMRGLTRRRKAEMSVFQAKA